MPARASNLVWLWTLLPLLLAAALSIPLLDDDSFSGDEPRSLVVSGRYASGPQTLPDVRNFIVDTDPDQALGWPMLLFVWGRIAGWSEVAIRALSLFAGLLSLAWVYRIGRDLFAPAAGLFAALLLSASVFLIAYMIHARAFTMVALCTALCLWSYWRIALHPQLPGRGAQAGLLLGSIGLLYAHYYCLLFLPALGLFHLLFVPKNRRWWQPVLLLAIAALLAMLQLPGFLQGLDKAASNEDLHNRALTAPALVSHVIRYMTNGLLDPSPPLNGLLLICLLLVLVFVTLLRLRDVIRASSLWLLAWTSLTTLVVMIAINALIQVIVDNRIRYLMPLWPLSALLAGAGLWRLANRHRILATGMLALWLISGAWLILVTDFRYGLGHFPRSDIHLAYRFVRNHVPENNVLIIEREIGYRNWSPMYASTLGLPFGYLNLGSEQPLTELTDDHTMNPWFWLLYKTEGRAAVLDEADMLGWVRCDRALDDWGLTLERHAWSAAHCPDSPARLQFEADIQLTGPDIQLEDGLLRLHAGFHSADNYLLAHYSLAVHIIDPLSGERVAQGDTGVGPGTFVPLRSEIDVSALPPGEYDLRVALYDWQTGARLPARDLVTGASGDMHTLYSFRIG